MSEKQTKLQNVILENREKITISGINEVKNFDEDVINLSTQLGELTIKGENLHITKMDVDSGDIMISGNIFGLVYNDSVKSSFWSKVFK